MYNVAKLKNRLKQIQDDYKIVARDKDGNLIPLSYVIIDDSKKLVTIGSGVDQEIEELLCLGKKIDAVRLYKERAGCGIGEAKMYVEKLQKCLKF